MIAPKSSRGAVRRLYDWVLGWADRPGGTWALLGISLAEASFFPIPPDVLLIPLALGKPRKAWFFAFVCTAGSVLGAVIGYLIGSLLFTSIGQPILDLYGAVDQYDELGRMYNDNLVVTLGTAGFTPIPFKVFTIAAGAFGVAFVPFVLVSAISRAGRFFLVAGLIRLFGESIREFIDRWFNLLSILLVVLIVAGFLAIRFFFGSG